jgi:hypothetical protein
VVKVVMLNANKCIIRQLDLDLSIVIDNRYKEYNGLHHHVSIIKTAQKHTWIITFGVQAKKKVFRGTDPAKIGLVDSSSRLIS